MIQNFWHKGRELGLYQQVCVSRVVTSIIVIVLMVGVTLILILRVVNLFRFQNCLFVY